MIPIPCDCLAQACALNISHLDSKSLSFGFILCTATTRFVKEISGSSSTFFLFASQKVLTFCFYSVLYDRRASGLVKSLHSECLGGYRYAFLNTTAQACTCDCITDGLFSIAGYCTNIHEHSESNIGSKLHNHNCLKFFCTPTIILLRIICWEDIKLQYICFSACFLFSLWSIVLLFK